MKNSDDHNLSAEEQRRLADLEEEIDENEFIPCNSCDGHPACEDFGCAFELGLGRMVKSLGSPWN